MWLSSTVGQRASGINLMILDLTCLRKCVLLQKGALLSLQ
jgi:hypothetical protein